MITACTSCSSPLRKGDRPISTGIALPTGRRVLLPTEEVRDFFHDRANHFAELETVAEATEREIGAVPAELNFAIAERLRRHAEKDAAQGGPAGGTAPRSGEPRETDDGDPVTGGPNVP